jgi:hypothetical protein
MTEDVFNELLDGVHPLLEEEQASNPRQQSYSKKHKLIITMYIVSHCSTMRTPQSLFGCPHNMISCQVLWPTVASLERLFLDNPGNRASASQLQQRTWHWSWMDFSGNASCLATLARLMAV